MPRNPYAEQSTPTAELKNVKIGRVPVGKKCKKHWVTF